MSVCLAALSACVLALATAGTASAASDLAQRSGPAGCVDESGTSGCQNGRGLVGPASIALSPDGANAYVASQGWDSVSILDRNPADGSLSPVQSAEGCFDSFNVTYFDCTPTSELGGAYDVAVSPDGKNVYVTAPADSAVKTFVRDTSSGLLAPAGCVNQEGSGGCADGRALDGATSVTVSSDGSEVYVASSGLEGGIAIFDRDPGTGALTQRAGTAGCIDETGEQSCAESPYAEMLDLRDVEISPDGKSAYAVSRTRNAITLYNRSLADGSLSPTGCINEAGNHGCQDGTALIRAEGVSFSPDGSSVYVAGTRSDAIAIFDRNPASGQLTQKPGTAGCISNTGQSDQLQASTAGACADGLAMDGIDSIAVSPDGNALYATTEGSSGIDVFERAADGGLTQRPETQGCITDTGYESESLPWTAGYCADGMSLREAHSVIVSGDGRYVYTASLAAGVGIFDVVAAPTPAAPQAQPGPTPTTSPDHRSVGCIVALAKQRSLRHKLHGRRHTVARLTQQAESGPLGPKGNRALNKSRRQIPILSKQLRHADGMVQKSCPKTG